MRSFYLLFFTLLASALLQAQEPVADDTHALYILTLKCREGGVFGNQPVTFTNLSDKSEIKARTGADGKVKVSLPVGATYELRVSNFSETRTIPVPDQPNLTIGSTMSYSKNDLAFEAQARMNSTEAAAVDAKVAALKDTTVYLASQGATLKADDTFGRFEISLTGVDKKPLVNETAYLTGRKNKKTFVGKTGPDGHVVLLLPKGDVYDLSFRYDKGYDTQEMKYQQGTINSRLQIEYLGTVEIERRMKEKEKRLKEEAIRREKERKEFEARRKTMGLSAIKAHKAEIDRYVKGKTSFADNVVLKVLERNSHWKDKLIVCDLTGSMSPYAGQLELWYSLNFAKEQNLQFVFFNDGDEMPDGLKKIGETGGIYYSPSKGPDSLAYKMAYVQSAGSGGDGPENNMEALIKGTKAAKPYKELVMIADNNAPVKDIALLESFKVPVRIILCGVGDEIEADYLRIAWKTKGSVHTMEEDLFTLGKLLDGQDIKINNKTYRLMKGKFVLIYKT